MLGEIPVAQDLMRKGLPIFVEYGDNSRVYIITEYKGRWVGIQVKSIPVKDGKVTLTARKTGPGGYNYKYKISDFDVMAVYCVNKQKVYYISLPLILKNGKEVNLRVRKSKNGNEKGIRYAKHFTSFSKSVKYCFNEEKPDYYVGVTKEKIKVKRGTNNNTNRITDDIIKQYLKLGKTMLLKDAAAQVGFQRDAIKHVINKKKRLKN